MLRCICTSSLHSYFSIQKPNDIFSVLFCSSNVNFYIFINAFCLKKKKAGTFVRFQTLGRDLLTQNRSCCAGWFIWGTTTLETHHFFHTLQSNNNTSCIFMSKTPQKKQHLKETYLMHLF